MKSNSTLPRLASLPALAAGLALLAGACGTTAPVTETAPAEPAAPTARSIIDRYVRATNTDAMIAETSSAHMLGTIELASMGLKGDMEIHAAKPDRFLLRSSMGPAGTTLVGYDGEVGWMSNPMLGTSLLEGVELFSLEMQADYRAALMDPADYDVVELEGTEEFEGRPCYRIRMVYRAPEDPELAEESLKARTSIRWFDAETGMMLGMESTQSSMQGEVEVLTKFDEYATIAGYTYPVRTTQKMMGMEIVTTIDDTEVNAVDPSVFELPDDVKALLDE